jgi:hypothetical protein
VLQTLVRVTHNHVSIDSVTSSIVGPIPSFGGRWAKLEPRGT